MLDILVVKIRHGLLHAFHVFCAALSLHEAEEVGANLRSMMVAASFKKMGKTFYKRNKTRHGSDDVLCGIGECRLTVKIRIVMRRLSGS